MYVGVKTLKSFICVGVKTLKPIDSYCYTLSDSLCSIIRNINHKFKNGRFYKFTEFVCKEGSPIGLG
jgi:hypothetical protein